MRVFCGHIEIAKQNKVFIYWDKRQDSFDSFDNSLINERSFCEGVDNYLIEATFYLIR